MLTALTIAGVAGYFSVYGLAFIYQGAFLSVVLMGGALEVGKIIATSYLYRYWSATSFILKTYLMVAIFGLMLITSSGIFGYLSSAYQKDTVGIKDVQARIELMDNEYAELSRREQEIDQDINRVGSNYVTARLNLMKQYAGEKDIITERRNVIRQEKLALSTKQLEVEAHTGPIIYIAKAMGKTIDEAVMWMSLLIIAVFDPLAIALTIAANSVLVNSTKEKHRLAASVVDSNVVPEPKIVEVEKEVVVERIVEVPIEMKLDEGYSVISDAELEGLKYTVNFTEQALSDATTTIERYELEKQRIENELTEKGTQLHQLSEENDVLVSELEHIVRSKKDDNDVELGLLNQVQSLTNSIQQAESDLAIAINALEKRDVKIETLEQHNATLEQQIVELRMQMRKFEMSAADRARLHHKNVTDSKNSQ